ncbi:MAG: winged helix-turn-helix domain-containing protein [Candidatus Nealsonbacteria bacterium DGGOD1a]|nr:MAG: winged helix-turn-helix domain-containing protein [Candidatus Nealsonbacteria bacterium DGGOD1a]UMX47881.1 MAG: winged helix-turn-helix domain-containing protein [Candidatus Nealsonbacteria bacterium DGGOD1a]
MKNRKSSPSCKSKDDLQKRRIKAIKLWEKGQTQYKIAKKLGVSFEAVSNWVEAYKAQGWDGLKSKGNPGPDSKLTQEEKREIKKAILKGAQKQGYATDLWTLARLRDLIKKISGTKYHPGHVWRVVISLGFTSQKPEIKAKERDEKAIKTWRVKTFPRLKKMGAKTSF